MATKQNKSYSTDDDTYHLIYWPGIPGRGEFIRLVLEEASAKYTDTAQIPQGINQVLSQNSAKNLGDDLNPPPFAPPMLQHKHLTLSQTPNILQYLGPRLHLSPDPSTDPFGYHHVNALTLTALDGLSNEVHDTHHPIAVGEYYETQKDESLRRAKDYRVNRLPKFLGYFERVLSGPASKGGNFLYGGEISYADLVLFQCVDGLGFAFPKVMERLKGAGEYGRVFGLYERVKARERIGGYLKSERRQKYGMGIYRRYPELDDE